MPPYAILALSLAIVVVGVVAMIWMSARNDASRHGPSLAPPSGVEAMGYGTERWRREIALWQGVLRRLEIQARHQSPVSETLQRQMDEARQKIAEAERHIT